MTGHRLTVGVVTPHAAAGPEVELPAMTDGRVATVVSRTSLSREARRTAPSDHLDLRASTWPSALDRAAVDFGDAAVVAVVHASTTTGYVIGREAESALVAAIERRFRVPAVASCAAASAALQAHGVTELQLVHPPWFDADFDDLGAAYFRSQGFSVQVTRPTGLPDDPARVEPRHVVDAVGRQVADRAEAVFLAGNGFRAAGAVEELERRTGRLVVEANQALLWGVRGTTDVGLVATGPGRLLHGGRG